jgi:predicted RNase H-like HicB family nuclease
MLSQYIDAAMALARYQQLDDGSYYGEITELAGVWGDGPTAEACRTTLREVVEDWIVLSLRSGDNPPILAGAPLVAVDTSPGRYFYRRVGQ